MQKIAILCCHPRTVYHQFDDLELYDKKRDAMTFDSGMSVIAHPPCRLWSIKTRHQAKPHPGERELGIFCAEKVKQCGGVLEQPAGSRLFNLLELPGPDIRENGLWTIQVCQYWWGFPTIKKTWLCFSGIDVSRLIVPFRLISYRSGKEEYKKLSNTGRSRTTYQFAEWLINAVRQ